MQKAQGDLGFPHVSRPSFLGLFTQQLFKSLNYIFLAAVLALEMQAALAAGVFSVSQALVAASGAVLVSVVAAVEPVACVVVAVAAGAVVVVP